MNTASLESMLNDDDKYHADLSGIPGPKPVETLTSIAIRGLTCGFTLKSILTTALAGYHRGGYADAVSAARAMIEKPQP